MAVPSYTTNLAVVANADALTTDPGTWAELTNHLSGGTQTDETDYYIHNSHCVSQSTGSKTGTTCGLQYDYGSNVSWSTGYCVFMWMIFLAPVAIDTWSNGGIRMVIGSSSGNVKFFNAVGNDFGRNPYGGWQNIAVDPTYSAGDATAEGTPGTTYRIFGSLPNITAAVSKGNPHAVDIIRAGRGDIVVTAGSLADGYATFAGMATTNDGTTARWGLFSSQQGSYLWKGLMTLGTSGTAVSFVDSNRSIIVDSCPRTYSSFNRIEINNASSSISWTNISFKSLLGPGGAASLTPGELAVIDNATITMDTCSFQDMATFTFQSNSSVTNSIFKNCGLITSGGGTFTGTKVLTSTVAADASAFGWNSSTNPDGYLDNMVFSKGTNAHHAINFGTSSPTTITLRGITFTGFSTSNSQNDSVLYIARTTGTVTIQCIGTVGTVSYKSAGATVVITQGVITKVTVKDIDSGSAIENARVLVAVADSTNFPYKATVSMTASGTTVTVTHTGHGLNTGDYVITEGATNDDNYNGVHSITYVSSSSYTFVADEAPAATPASGTLKATFAFISGLTNASGVISDQRVVSANQPVVGWARKASSDPYYKQQPIVETVDAANGLSVTVQLIKDQ